MKGDSYMTRGKCGRGGKGCRRCRIAFAAIRNGDPDPEHPQHLRSCHHYIASGRKIPELGQIRQKLNSFWNWDIY
jgi:hypothetical protein